MIELASFQIKAMDELFDGMSSDKQDIVLKSPTGSGKTIILTHFMKEYLLSYPQTVFVWLTPKKGGLEEQSKGKMDKYIHGSRTKLLADIMVSGFEADDVCFINWEKLNSRNSKALTDSERTNFIEHIRNAQNNGLSFKIVVDEAHTNETVRSNDILEFFKADKIIRCSATPNNYTDAFFIEVPESEVIASGLIKKQIIINQDFPQTIDVEGADEILFLLDKALEKQIALKSEFARMDSDINPLIVIQIPNAGSGELMLDTIERYFENKAITYESGGLAVWLSDKKENLEDIEDNNAKPIAVIVKQAVATGWDCPRACILVKLRENMNETFEIQTIGRIRRMPEAKHYENGILDSAYLYTLDERFIEETKKATNGLEAVTLYLKPEHKNFKITSQFKTNVPFSRGSRETREIIYNFFKQKYNLDNDLAKNQTRLQTKDYVFNDKIVDYTRSGSVSMMTAEQFNDLNKIDVLQKLDTHKHGREYHHYAAEIGRKISIEYSYINTILRDLFIKKLGGRNRIVGLDIRQFYAFVINNKDRLRHDLYEALSAELGQTALKSNSITEKEIGLPQEMIFTYDKTAKVQTVIGKNVYKGYLASAERRSTSEKLFEKFCENNDNVEWFYKNGDKGEEYFAIVYEDNLGKQKSFYPDYIVCVKDKIWIVETKGGWSGSGKSEDIDPFSPKKFDILKKYLDKYGLQGGFVRQDKQSTELFICKDEYSDDSKNDKWELLREVM